MTDLLDYRCRYWLARAIDGEPLRVQLVDGCHGDEIGVAKAAKLRERIFGSDRDAFFMVEIHALPNVDVEVNEDSADTCRRLLEGAL